VNVAIFQPETDDPTVAAPALVFWRPYANWNLAALVGDHEAISANWSI